MQDNSYHFKLVLLGDTAVGKSCLVVRFVKDEFFAFQEPTIGGIYISFSISCSSPLAAFLSKNVTIDNSTVQFEIWDTAGQGILSSFPVFSFLNREIPQFGPHVLQRCCCRHCRLRYHQPGISSKLAVDLSQDSFAGAKTWVKELQRRGDPNVVIALAGNKNDLEENRQVPTEEAREYAAENDLIFLETSAKTADHVQDVFTEIGMSL